MAMTKGAKPTAVNRVTVYLSAQMVSQISTFHSVAAAAAAGHGCSCLTPAVDRTFCGLETIDLSFTVQGTTEEEQFIVPGNVEFAAG